MSSHVSGGLRVDLGNLETLSGSHYFLRIALHYNFGLTDRHSLQRHKSCHPGWLHLKIKGGRALHYSWNLHSTISARFLFVFVLITLLILQFGASIAKSEFELPFLALIHLGGGLLLPRPLSGIPASKIARSVAHSPSPRSSSKF